MLLPEPSTGRTKLIQPDLQALCVGLHNDLKVSIAAIDQSLC